MAQTVKITPNPTRQAALARRQAMSQGGKAALAKPASMATPAPAPAAVAAVRVVASSGTAVASPSSHARSASLARRQALAAFGKTGVKHHDRVRTKTATPVAMPAASNVDTPPQPAAAPAPRRLVSAPVRRVNSPANTTRALVLARRKAMSNGGKAAIPSASSSAAQTMRAANPQMSSRDLAKALRNQNSRTGKAGKITAPPTGRVRPSRTAAAADPAKAENGAEKAPVTRATPNRPKLSALTITGTNPGRSQKTTGSEAGTCRSVTGTEYMAADIFDQFCQSGTSDMAKSMTTSTISPITRSGQSRSSNAVTGDEIHPSSKMTGTETGAARNLTGMQYFATGTTQTAHGRSASTPTREPRKPLISHDTPRNNGVTGALTAQGGNVTGDEPGKCNNISGDFYIGGHGRAAVAPAVPRERKAEASHASGSAITGTMSGSASNITGGDPGACSAITGTGYNSAENHRNFRAPEAARSVVARTTMRHATSGAVLTGLQPGIGGKLTGAGKGACEPLSGTPYVGADQFAQACETPAAPQPAPSRRPADGNITGTRYNQGEITGPFGMATGVVTGTADFHSLRHNAPVAPINPQPVAPAPQPAASFEGRVKARISGEGMDSGLKITGDDWDRGDRVTGTEGRSVVQRNPTRRGQAVLMSAPVAPPEKRNEEMRMAVSKVTGGSGGSTEKGSLITYSGGARG